MLRNELSRLNKRIDNKILMGYPYESDAKRHKLLLETLTKIMRRERISEFTQSILNVGRSFAKLRFTLF